MAIQNFEAKLQSYARILVTRGINAQPGEVTVVYISVEQQKFAHAIVDELYKNGASRVIVQWQDDFLNRAGIVNNSLEAIDNPTPMTHAFAKFVGEELPNRLYITSKDPDSLTGVDPERIGRTIKANSLAMKPVSDASMSDKLAWCVAGAASPAWAKKVFPGLGEDEAVEALWNAIFSVARIDVADPDQNWSDHLANLTVRADWLNEQAFDKLHFTDNGTDLEVGLPKGHIWGAASSLRQADNKVFIPNMPTEEIFTAPDFRRVNGVVSSTKPLVFAGTPILDMVITFKDGKVVDYKASAGIEALEALLATDEQSNFLGEVALVPDNTPISQSNTLFYETLYDENASNHLAFGEAYPTTIQGGTDLDEEGLLAAGMNVSLTHEDFMIGSKTTSIDGVKADGTVVPIFRNGTWVD